MNKKQYMTVKEASEYLGIPLSTAYDLVRAKKIKSIKIGGTIRCLAKDIKKYTNSFIAQTKSVDFESNKRKHSRINTDFSCHYSKDLHGFKDIVVRGLIVNLSPEGVFIQEQDCEGNMIRVDDPIMMKFIMSVKKNELKEINVRGRVLRKQENGFAVKFRQVDENLKEYIKEYIG